MGKVSRRGDESAKEEKLKRQEHRMRSRGQLARTFRKAAIVLVIGAALSFAVQVYSGVIAEVKVLKTANEMKEAFFGGRSWLIQCIDDKGVYPVHEITKKTAGLLAAESKAKVGALVCDEKMPSGNTFWKRFNLKRRSLNQDTPLLFLAANGDPPKPVAAKHSQNSKKLAEYVLTQSKSVVHKLKSDSDLRTHCLRRRFCVMLVSAGEYYPPSWLMDKVVSRFRSARFVSVDSDKYRLSLESEVSLTKLATVPDGSPHMMVLAPRRGKKTGKVKGVGVTLHSEKFDANDVTVFLESVLKQGDKTKQLQLSLVPSLRIRRGREPGSVPKQTQPKPQKARSPPPPPPPSHEPDGRHHIRAEELQDETFTTFTKDDDDEEETDDGGDDDIVVSDEVYED